MSGFTKLFASITESSIWTSDDRTLRVWIAMLARANADGIVEGSIPGFASLCRMQIEDFERVLSELSGPDRYSRTPDHEGRRIEAVPGGWKILNYLPYREKGQAKDGSRAPYFRAYRQKLKGSDPVARNKRNSATVARNTEAEAEAEAEAESKSPHPPAANRPPTTFPAELDTTAFREAWKAFEEYRKQRRLPRLQQVSVAAKLKEMAAWGEAGAIQAIHTAIANGWQSAHAPKGQHSPASHRSPAPTFAKGF